MCVCSTYIYGTVYGKITLMFKIIQDNQKKCLEIHVSL